MVKTKRPTSDPADDGPPDDNAPRRAMFTGFGMWTICPDKRCIRARACRGDVEECLEERWHVVVPANIKALVQKTFALIADGVPPVEAVRQARDHVEKVDRYLALIDRRQNAAQPAAAPPPRAGPRVRRL
jgi:hypothetical protein